MDYLIHLLILIGIYFILAQSFNLSFGLGGLLNLAHIAVYAIGAYTTALLSTEFDYSFWICAPASMATSAICAFIIGGIAIKLSYDYFAIGSLAFSAIVTALLINWKSITRGVLGIPGIPRPDIFGIDFYDNTNFLSLTFVMVVISGISLRVLFHSSFARSLRAQAEDIFSAQSIAKDVRAVRNHSFIVASLFAGLAGSLFAYYINYIDPSSFSLLEMVFVLSIVIVGKPGSFWGVTASTVFLVLLPEPLRFVELPPSIVGPMRQLLYAVILFGVIFWNRRSLFPVQRKI